MYTVRKHTGTDLIISTFEILFHFSIFKQNTIFQDAINGYVLQR